jgi:regulator of cell morphogenesis and NO signaling
MKSKKPMIIPDMKVSDIIMNNYYLILMLEYFGINLTVQEKNIHEVCLENKINVEVFLTFANLFNGIKYTPSNEFTFDDLQTIIGYLKKCHEYYLDEKYPKIQRYIKRIQELNNLPEIKLVDIFFNEYFNEVKAHLDYENNVVFPYINRLFKELNQQTRSREENTYSVIEYKEHHDDIEVKLTDIKNLLIKYLPQQNEQKERRKLLFSLFELEYDLNIHAQIEDSILVPLVEKMELQLKQG